MSIHFWILCVSELLVLFCMFFFPATSSKYRWIKNGKTPPKTHLIYMRSARVLVSTFCTEYRVERDCFNNSINKNIKSSKITNKMGGIWLRIINTYKSQNWTFFNFFVFAFSNSRNGYFPLPFSKFTHFKSDHEIMEWEILPLIAFAFTKFTEYNHASHMNSSLKFHVRKKSFVTPWTVNFSHFPHNLWPHSAHSHLPNSNHAWIFPQYLYFLPFRC